MAGYGYSPGRYGVPTSPQPAYKPAPPVSGSTQLSPYASRTSQQTTGYNPGFAGSLPAQPSKTVAPTPASQPSSAPQPAHPTADYAGFDPNTDPVYQQVQAASTRSLQEAQASSLAQQKQLAIQYGDADLAGRIGDPLTAKAAADNPYSVYGLLSAQQPKDQLALDESLNKNNLFYSGARVNQQRDLADTYGQHRAEAAGQEQAAYGQILAQLLGAQNTASGSVTQALGDAYNRYLTQLLATIAATPTPGSSGGGGGGDSSPVDNGALVDYTPPSDVSYQGPVYTGVPVNAPGAATGKKPGRTVGGYIPGGAIRT